MLWYSFIVWLDADGSSYRFHYIAFRLLELKCNRPFYFINVSQQPELTAQDKYFFDQD